MKTIIYLFFTIVALFLFQSCDKKEDENTIIICPANFASIYKWREDSINAGKTGTFNKVGNGKVLTWLSSYNTLDKSEYGTYHDLTNIRTGFEYIILPDSVFSLKVIADSVYFYDKERNIRTDLIGHVTFAPDTSLVLLNTAVSPAITIKYKFEK